MTKAVWAAMRLLVAIPTIASAMALLCAGLAFALGSPFFDVFRHAFLFVVFLQVFGLCVLGIAVTMSALFEWVVGSARSES